MVKSSGIPERKWIRFGNGLKSACKGSVNWSVGKTSNGTIFVEAKCNDLNEKHKKLIIAEKTNGKYDFKEYITKLRAQFLIHVDEKTLKLVIRKSNLVMQVHPKNSTFPNQRP